MTEAFLIFPANGRDEARCQDRLGHHEYNCLSFAGSPFFFQAASKSEIFARESVFTIFCGVDGNSDDTYLWRRIGWSVASVALLQLQADMSGSIDDIPKPRMTPRALLRSILMLDDTPHSVALGTAIGMFVGMTPTVGIQMIIVLIVAFLTRRIFSFNRIAAVLTVYVTNPLTIIPIYWFNFKVGTCFIPSAVTYDDFVAIVQFDSHEKWYARVMSLVTDLGAPLLVGCLLVAMVSSVLTYPTMRWLLRRFHRRDDSIDKADRVETA